MNNTLDVQKKYFEALLAAKPENEAIRFSLATVHRALGDLESMRRLQDEGATLLDRNWIPKLYVFTAGGGLAALGVWAAGWGRPWLSGIFLLLGPLAWFLIRRNRQINVPKIGEYFREQLVEKVDMEDGLRTGALTYFW